MDLNELFGQFGKPSPERRAHRFDADHPHRTECGSPVLEAGRKVIAGMRQTTGSDVPEQGEMFGQAAARFGTAAHILAGADPSADWDGAAARAYTAANHRQAGRADSISVLDRRVHQVVSRQAHQIATRRENLDQQADFLADLDHRTRALALIPGVGQAAKTTMEVAAVATAVQQCEQDLHLLTSEVSDNAAELNQLAVGYASLAMPESPPALADGPLPGKDHPLPGNDDDVLDDRGDAQTGATTSAAANSDNLAPAGEAPEAVGAVVAPSAPPPSAPMPLSPAASSGAAPAAPADPMAGMNAAFGAVGGMIGAIVAPMSAVLTGAVSAATDSVSALTSGGDELASADTAALKPENADQARGDDSDDSAAAPEPEPTGASPGDTTTASVPPPVTEGARTPAPADTLERDVPPPAATRPPQ